MEGNKDWPESKPGSKEEMARVPVSESWAWAWVLAAVASLMVIGAARADAVPEASAGCGKPLDSPELQAGFRLAPGRDEMKLMVLGSRAQIWAGSACQAACDISASEYTGYGAILQMNCRGGALDALTTPATLTVGAAPSLRFGTWLGGYREASVRML
jgi:hypothetical protein